MMFVIAQRELRSLFLSPLAWSILAVVQIILAFLFLAQLQEFFILQPQLEMMENAPGVTEIVVAPLYGSSAFILMMVIPLITMRVVSDERRNRTLPLLFSAPVSMTEIVLGKFFGILGFLLIMTGLVTMMPLSILFAGPLDMGLLASIVLGIVLLIASFAAVGLFMSTLTVQPTVAAISTFGVLLLFWIIDWAGSKVDDPAASGVLSYLSTLRHFEAMAKGIFSSRDLIFYLLFITLFLVLSIRRLDNDRLQH